jgi:hypothetical protein
LVVGPFASAVRPEWRGALLKVVGFGGLLFVGE